MSEQLVRTLGPILHPRVAAPLTLLFLAAVVLGVMTVAPRILPPDASVPTVETPAIVTVSDEPVEPVFQIDPGYLAGQFELVTKMQRPEPPAATPEPGLEQGDIVTDAGPARRDIEFVGLIQDFRGLTAVLRVDGEQKWIRQDAERGGIRVLEVAEEGVRVEVDGVPREIERAKPTGVASGTISSPSLAPASAARPTFDPARTGRPTAGEASEDLAQRRAQWSRNAQRDIRRNPSRPQVSEADENEGREAGER